MSLRRRSLRALVLGGLAALTVAAFGASSAWAEPATYCVKATKVSKIISGKTKHVFTGGWTNSSCTAVSATHEGKFEKIKPSLLSEPEQEEVKAFLKYMKVQASGVGGKPTVQFSGANVQVVNGEGKTGSTNGAGNLVIGYDEHIVRCVPGGLQPPCPTGTTEEPVPYTQTGSHNLLLGTGNSFTSYGGTVGGQQNTLSAPFASVTDGAGNTASGEWSSVSGGGGNTASGATASVSGGETNTASGLRASVSGGVGNKASGNDSSAQGGGANEAAGTATSVGGGENNKVGPEAVSGWIGGGYKNEVFSKGTAGEEGFYAAIFGGKENKTAKNDEAIP